MAAALLTLLLCATPVPFPGFGDIGKGEDATSIQRKPRPTKRGDVIYGRAEVDGCCSGGDCGGRRVIRRHLQRFQTCYEHNGLLNRVPARGTVVLGYRIAESGVVLAAWIVRSSLADRDTERCLLRVVMRIRFRGVGEDPCCRGIREIRYPLRFTPVRKRFWVRVGG